MNITLASVSSHKFFIFLHVLPPLTAAQYNNFFFSIFGFVLLIHHERNYILRDDSENNFILNTNTRMHIYSNRIIIKIIKQYLSF